MPEPANLSEAFRDRTEALDALGRAVVARDEVLAIYNLVEPVGERGAAAWAAFAASSAQQIRAMDTYIAAHKTVQKFLNGDG